MFLASNFAGDLFMYLIFMVVIYVYFQLMKVHLYNCSQYTTCGGCLGAMDPYCGWCSLENK